MVTQVTTYPPEIFSRVNFVVKNIVHVRDYGVIIKNVIQLKIIQNVTA
jgi:hypothetical protein